MQEKISNPSCEKFNNVFVTDIDSTKRAVDYIIQNNRLPYPHAAWGSAPKVAETVIDCVDIVELSEAQALDGECSDTFSPQVSVEQALAAAASVFEDAVGVDEMNYLAQPLIALAETTMDPAKEVDLFLCHEIYQDQWTKVAEFLTQWEALEEQRIAEANLRAKERFYATQ